MRNYWWLEVTRDIEQYVEKCNICQRMKNRIEIPAEKLKLSKIPKKLWIHLMVDFITKLLLVAGKNTILVVYNRLSKITYFVITTKETLAEELVRLFRDNRYKLHKLLKSIVLDRGLHYNLFVLWTTAYSLCHFYIYDIDIILYPYAFTTYTSSLFLSQVFA